MLSPEETFAYFDEHYTRSAFRLETLDRYDVASDGGDYERYLAGEPSSDRDREWLREVAADEAAGKHRSRVHVVRTPLNDYLRFECEWGYVDNVKAGEEVRILDLSETTAPPGLLDEDYWLFDDRYVLRMVYDSDGRFHGAELADDPAPYVRCKEVALAVSTDFTTWWTAHPQEWRINQPAKA